MLTEIEQVFCKWLKKNTNNTKRKFVLLLFCLWLYVLVVVVVYFLCSINYRGSKPSILDNIQKSTLFIDANLDKHQRLYQTVNP